MCLTFRHDYGLEISEDDKMYTLMSGMTKRERESLYRNMAQIFDNDIAPYMTFIDKPDYFFTGDYFSAWKSQWDQYKEYLVGTFSKDLICVEAGTYEAMSALYMLDNMVGETGHLYTVDCFLLEHTKNICHYNIDLNPKKEQVTVIEGSSLTELPKLLDTLEEKVHFIYIDAGKTAMDNICNLAIAERLLAVNGMLVIDDYKWGEGKQVEPAKTPKPAVDYFMENSLLCETFQVGYQVAFVKRNTNRSLILTNQ
jgi:predicted O-methyltransferase YrrM